MGVLLWEKVNPTQLISRHVRHIIARKHSSGGQEVDNDQLLRAAESHAGFVIAADEPPRHLVEQVAKVATMRQGGGSAKSRVEAPISNLEKFLVLNPQADALNRTP